MARKTPSPPESAGVRHPLAGASIVVTRPSATASPLKRAVRALGGTALSLPGIALNPPEDPSKAVSEMRAARDSDIVIFVSPTAVRFAYALWPGLRFARKTRLYATGSATARALTQQGTGEVEWPRSRQDSEGLLELASLAQVRGQHIAIIGAPGGRELLVDKLRSRRAKIKSVHVYRRAPVHYTRRHLRALEQASAPLITVLTSALALNNLGQQLPLNLFARLAAGDLVVSSERLAALASRQMFRNVLVAASPAPRHLMNAACAVMARHRL